MNRRDGCETTKVKVLTRHQGSQGRMVKKNLAILAVMTGVFFAGGNRLLAQNVRGPQSNEAGRHAQNRHRER